MIKNKIFLDDKIFIAGASGMAGSAIKRALIKKEYGKASNGGLILTPNSKELNLLDHSEVNNWFKKYKPNITILAAAKVGGILANKSKPTDFILNNIKIQTNVIEAAWRNGVRRLLFLGSSCIYPKFALQPIKEEYLLSGHLETSNQSYAIAKIAGIKLCEALRKQYNFDAISIMPTNLYGPGDNYHPTDSHVMASLISKFCEAKKASHKSVICWGSGKPLREFLHVDDLGSAALFCLEKWDPDNINSPRNCDGSICLFLNVGTGKDISIFELANKISKIVGFNGEIEWDLSKPDGTPKKELDIEKILSLGWKPKISLNDGIKHTISNYLKIN
tara:strand:+ start:95 stop:1093 length:999 start_codon:yes stop_codon:yes gene_type:complete